MTLLAAAEGGGEGTSNFLIPNGTFFFVLAIFLIVLAVIGKFVVPPIQKVLGERERMAAKTAEDNRRAAELEAAADADYRKELTAGRSEAAAIRDEARTQGRRVIDDKRARATAEVDGALREANAISGDLRASAESLSVTLASRVLGVDIGNTSVPTGR